MNTCVLYFLAKVADGAPYGGFRCAQRKILAYRRSHFSEPVGFFTIPDRATTKNTHHQGVCFVGDLIGGFRYAQRKTRAYKRLYFSEPECRFHRLSR